LNTAIGCLKPRHFLGLALTSVSLKEYFSHQTVIYFFKNISLIFGVEFQLPGVFENVPWKNAVNGSLWTLPYEVKMYAYLLGIFVVINVLSKYLSLRLLGNFSFKKIIALIAISSVLFQFYLMLQNKEHTDFFRLFSFFFIGSFFYCYADKIPMKSIYLTISSLLLICTATYQYLFMEFYSLLLPYLVFSIAYIPKGRIRKFNDFGDYSYGFYIYAFPTQQLIAYCFTNITVEKMILYSSAFTFILAAFSWHFIEKKALSYKF